MTNRISRQRRLNILRHPLFITAIGFILTSVLGTIFSSTLNRIIREADLEAAARQRALQVVRDAADLVNERRTRAVMVASAIKRGGTKTEVEYRKDTYDDAYVRRNTKWPTVMLQTKEVLRKLIPKEDSELQKKLLTQMGSFQIHSDNPDFPIHRGTLSRMDACLTASFDKYREHNFVTSEDSVKILGDCKFDDLGAATNECAELLFDTLYGIADSSYSNDLRLRIAENIAGMEKICHPAAPYRYGDQPMRKHGLENER